jgi:hypothetical protein
MNEISSFTVQNLAEQRELPGECPQKNTHSPDGLRRFRYLNRRSLNGIAFTAQPEAPAGTKAGASGWA